MATLDKRDKKKTSRSLSGSRGPRYRWSHRKERTTMSRDEMRELLGFVIQQEMSATVPDFLRKGGRLHTKEACKETRREGGPKGCVIHRPTVHKLTGSPQVLRSTTLIEDTCTHGVGHPNPDSVAYLNWRDESNHWGTHGCDGCCGPLPERGIEDQPWEDATW